MRRFGEEKKHNVTIKLYRETIDDLKSTAMRIGVKKNAIIEAGIIDEIERLSYGESIEDVVLDVSGV